MRKLLIAFAMLAVSGCWPFGHHGPSPQQQYAEALMHGNAMAASQIWLNMTPEDRLKFSRGEGIAPDPAQAEDAKRQILNHYESEMQGEAGEASAPMEQSVPTPLGQALQSLPQTSGSSLPPPDGN